MATDTETEIIEISDNDEESSFDPSYESFSDIDDDMVRDLKFTYSKQMDYWTFQNPERVSYVSTFYVCLCVCVCELQVTIFFFT